MKRGRKFRNSHTKMAIKRCIHLVYRLVDIATDSVREIMKNSTSWHNLNGDRRYVHYIAPIYFLCNWLSNRRANAQNGERIRIRRFQTKQVDKFLDFCEPASSPSRTLTDLFLGTLPWGEITQELGALNIADLGCGRGRYAEFFSKVCGSALESYVGLDKTPSQNWETISADNKRILFREENAEDMVSNLKPNVNVVFSCSALEHFENDLEIFSQLRRFCDRKKEPVLQIHCVPSGPCLGLYGVHGVRQYTPSSIGLIWNKFKYDSNAILYELGGRACNQVHKKFITWPLRLRLGDQREKKKAEYERALQIAIESDMNTRIDGEPGFYALVMLTNTKSSLSFLP